MSRITNTDLARLLGLSENDLIDVDDFIEIASCIVTDMVSNCGKTFSSETLTKIELWLTAHYFCIRNPLIVKEKFENAENTYQRINSGTGILSTSYGQAANDLSQGCLNDINKLDTQIYFT